MKSAIENNPQLLGGIKAAWDTLNYEQIMWLLLGMRLATDDKAITQELELLDTVARYKWKIDGRQPMGEA
jgi:hypothetical protein